MEVETVNVRITITFVLCELTLLDEDHSNYFNLLALNLKVGSVALLYKCEETETISWSSSEFRMRCWSGLV